MSQGPMTSCRRKAERMTTKVQVLIHCRSRFQSARIVDYSQTGLQLEGTFGLIPSDRVEIELMSGARLPGKVEWSLGGQTGVVFPERLEDLHPAMEELARSAGQETGAPAPAPDAASPTGHST
jgi:PilZ domain